MTISFKILTKNPHGILLYSGPLSFSKQNLWGNKYVYSVPVTGTHSNTKTVAPAKRRSRRKIAPEDNREMRQVDRSFLGVQLRDGKLELVTGEGRVSENRIHRVNTSYDLSDGAWHSVDISIIGKVSHRLLFLRIIIITKIFIEKCEIET